MARIPIERYFVSRLTAALESVHGSLESFEHGEGSSMGYIGDNLMLFSRKVDDDGTMNALVQVYVVLAAKAVTETLVAVAAELGVTHLETGEPEIVPGL